jgi:hypothetical protein
MGLGNTIPQSTALISVANVSISLNVGINSFSDLLSLPNINVANACNFQDVNKQAEWPRVDTGSSQLVRTGVTSGTSLPKTGVQTTPSQAATVFVIVKAKKTTIARAPMNTSWVSTETFTVTSR